MNSNNSASITFYLKLQTIHEVALEKAQQLPSTQAPYSKKIPKTKTIPTSTPAVSAQPIHCSKKQPQPVWGFAAATTISSAPRTKTHTLNSQCQWFRRLPHSTSFRLWTPGRFFLSTKVCLFHKRKSAFSVSVYERACCTASQVVYIQRYLDRLLLNNVCPW